MSQNGQTHFKNLARFLKCVWPFCDIAKWRVNIHYDDDDEDDDDDDDDDRLCFCGMVNQRTTLDFISSRHVYQKFSPSPISDTLRVGFVPT